MTDLLSSKMKSIKAMIDYLKLLESEQALQVANKAGIILAKELDTNERKILGGNTFIAIGSILIKLSCFSNEEKIKWQQTREVEIEIQEIEIEPTKNTKVCR